MTPVFVLVDIIALIGAAWLLYLTLSGFIEDWRNPKARWIDIRTEVVWSVVALAIVLEILRGLVVDLVR